MKIRDLCNYLESIADLSLQENYDNSGLIYGNSETEITNVLCALDCTVEILQEAKQRNCNIVVSHHPIVFNGIKKITTNYYVHRALIFAIQNEIAIYAIHTNIDNVLKNGVNEKIANKLGLTDLKILSPRPGSNDIGAGLTGKFNQIFSFHDFLGHVKSCFKVPVIKHTIQLKNTIQNIAVTGGSGSFLIKQAIASGADAFITADIKYHDFFEANNQIVIIDVGHYESEQFTIELLVNLISEKFRNFATHYTKISTNPVQYY